MRKSSQGYHCPGGVAVDYCMAAPLAFKHEKEANVGGHGTGGWSLQAQ